MSKISNAILGTLLEEITDYCMVTLSEGQYIELSKKCDKWEDKSSIESEINIFLSTNNYTYNTDKCTWRKQ